LQNKNEDKVKTMQKHKLTKSITAILLVSVMMFVIIGCSTETIPEQTSIPEAQTPVTQTAANTAATPAPTPAEPEEPAANTSPITVVWYPNESANDYEPAREEFGRLITEVTGREVIHRLTTDYVIAVESIASGAADIGAVFGAVGMLEAQQRNPEVMPLFVNSGASGTLTDAVYYSWLTVNNGDESQYASGNTFSIENIQGKKISFVSNSSTSGFRVPSANMINFFSQTSDWSNIDEDDILGLSRTPFFNEVLFGNSHQGTLFNLLDGRADLATVCDTCVDSYIELVSGTHNAVGAVYRIQEGAAEPFEGMAGKEFILIGVVPVLNGPNIYNPQNFTDAEIAAIREIFTSDETADNPMFFGESGTFSLYPKNGEMRYVVAENSWWDPLR